MTTFKREGPEDWVTKQLLSIFRVDDEGLRRLAIFLLAHTWADVRLIAVALERELDRIEATRPLTLDDFGDVSDKRAALTFNTHLKVANDWGLLSQEAYTIADTLNKAREHLLHWNRHRGLKKYDGRDVTTDEGFSRVMTDVHRFDELVPFPPYRPRRMA